MSDHKELFPSNLLVLIIFVLLISFLASTIYHELLIEYLHSFGINEYAYMYVLVPLLLFVLFDILYVYFEPVGLSIDRLFLGLGLYFSSLMFYLIYRLYNVNIVQYGLLSLIFLVWGYIVFVYRPIDVKYYFFTVSLMILFIPPPISWLNYLSNLLSRVTAYLASVLVGATAEEVSNRFYVWVVDSFGNKHLFEITHACSGIISLTSVLSIIPLLVYLVIKSSGGLSLKIKALFLGIVVSSGITFLGNLLRLVIIFLITKYYSYDLAMTIFHQSPSLLYVFLAVVSGFYVLRKIMGEKLWSLKEAQVSQIRGRGLFSGSLVFVFILLITMSIGYGVFANNLSATHSTGSVVLLSINTLIEDPLSSLFKDVGVKLLSNEPAPYLREVLGSSIVRKITIRYNGKVFRGYFEVAETPTRMHGWYVCLTNQGYRIIKSWNSRDRVVINYLLITRKNEVLLLAYATYKLLVFFGNTTQPVYVRLSLFAPTTLNKYEGDMLVLEELFQKIAENTENMYSSSVDIVFEKLVYIVNAFVLLSFFLVIISLFKHKLTRLTRFLSNRRYF